MPSAQRQQQSCCMAPSLPTGGQLAVTCNVFCTMRTLGNLHAARHFDGDVGDPFMVFAFIGIKSSIP